MNIPWYLNTKRKQLILWINRLTKASAHLQLTKPQNYNPELFIANTFFAVGPSPTHWADTVIRVEWQNLTCSSILARKWITRIIGWKRIEPRYKRTVFVGLFCFKLCSLSVTWWTTRDWILRWNKVCARNNNHFSNRESNSHVDSVTPFRSMILLSQWSPHIINIQLHVL